MDWGRKLREQYAISVRPEWLDRVLEQLRAAHPDLATWPEAQVVEKIFTAFLFCDLNQAGEPALPPNTKARHASAGLLTARNIKPCHLAQPSHG